MPQLNHFRCFVIMPFGDPERDPAEAQRLELIYSRWIKPTVESVQTKRDNRVGIVCHRADQSARPEEIIRHVIEQLASADIVIADLTGRNANVFYELGVRHAIRNNTILIADRIDSVPFDLRGLRTIIYRYEPELMLKLKESLEEAIRAVLAEPEQIDNPVQRYLQERQLSRIMEEQSRGRDDAIERLTGMIEHLKKQLDANTIEFQRFATLITSRSGAASSQPDDEPAVLRAFEGIWHSPINGSVVCARVVNEELLAPYCYGGSGSLTGHYHHCRIVGDTLFAQFEWFDSEIYGYAFYRVMSTDRLSGGWWYGQDVPASLRFDFSVLNEAVPGMNSASLVRVGSVDKMPEWARRYFRERLKNPL